MLMSVSGAELTIGVFVLQMVVFVGTVSYWGGSLRNEIKGIGKKTEENTKEIGVTHQRMDRHLERHN